MPKPIVVKPGSHIKLKDIDANSAHGIKDRATAEKQWQKDRQRLGELQGRLYGENTRALLVVLQGMDTSGKDGTIKHVFSSVSPIGCQVYAFGPPSEEERDHDFLWRFYSRMPRRGNIGIFNRSHYEDVLVVRVKKLCEESVWKPRFKQINAYEELISDLGTTVLKFFLHIDRDEQRERLTERLQDKTKNWKYQPSDLEDRAKWDDFQAAYEDVFARTSTKAAPWHIVPANKKWYRNCVIAQAIADTLEGMEPTLPKIDLDPKSIKIPK